MASREVSPPGTGELPVPGAKAGSTPVDVEGDVHGTGPDSGDVAGGYFPHRIALVHLLEDGSVAGGKGPLLGIAPLGPDADLMELATFDQPFLDRVPERGAVMVLVSPDGGVARVEMRVDMDDGERAVLLRDRAKGGEGDGVVAAEGKRNGASLEDASHLVLDRVASKRWRERRYGDVPAVGGA